MTDQWIVIRRWDDFQHYRNRQPKWIKVYTRLLHDDAYLELTVAQRGILHGLWLLYAEQNQVLSSTYARHVLATNQGESSHFARNLKALNHAGFITLSASKPLARRYQDASPREEILKTSTSKVEPYLAKPPKRSTRKSAEQTLPGGLLEKVMRLKGADKGTPNVIAAFARRGLPEAAFRTALEATQELDLDDGEILYYVGVLRTMERNGQYQ